ncbi:MAG: hypothetical protein R2709_07195 [Marmoricola sp.]
MMQRFISGRSLPQQIEYGAQLADIAGAVGESPSPPTPSSSTNQAQPVGPGLPKAEPSAAATIVTRRSCQT